MITIEEFRSFAEMISKDMEECVVKVDGFTAIFHCVTWRPSAQMLDNLSNVAYVSISIGMNKAISVYISVWDSEKKI